MKVLIVDDSPTQRATSAEIFRLLGHEVDTCRSGDRAVIKMKHSLEKQNPFDVIIMDWRMPVMGGDEATRFQLILHITQIYRAHAERTTPN